MKATDIPQVTISVKMPAKDRFKGGVVHIPLFTVPDENGVQHFPLEVESAGSSEDNHEMVELAIEYLRMSGRFIPEMLKIMQECIK